MLKSLEQAPRLAALGLGVVIACVAVLPLLRDPDTVAALEASDGPAPSSSPRSSSSDDEPPRKSGVAATGSASAAKPSGSPLLPLFEPSDSAPTIELDQANTPEALRALSLKYPKDPKLLTKLVKALVATPNGLHEALVTSRRIFELSEASMKDAELQTVVKRGASGQPATSDLALDIMAASMGSTGPDLLFELSNAKGVAPRVRTKAAELTKSDGVKKLATPALRVAIDLRDRGGCDRAALFAEAEKSGDSRSLSFLTPLQARKGCGLFRLSDCYACLGNRAGLSKAIEAIKKRSK